MDNAFLKELGKNARRRLAKMEETRKPWLADCKEISRHMAPERGRFPGEKPERKTDRSSQYNSRPDKYLNNLASMLQSGLTSPARPWFRLTLREGDMNEWGAAKEWLSQVENIFERVFRSTNFYPVIHSAYMELGAFGSACVGSWAALKDPGTGEPRFAAYTAGEWFSARDAEGETEAVTRIVHMAAGDALDRWGSVCSKRLKEMAERDPYDTAEIIHATERRKNRAPGKIDGLNKPWSSLWIEAEAEDAESGGVLSAGGFEECPYCVARWDAASADPYGAGPGSKAVKDARSLNLLDQIATYGLNKAVNPPVLAPAHLNVRLNNAPGGVTYYAGNAGESQIKPLYTVGADLNAALVFMNRWEEALKETFQNDLFIFLMNRSNVTATEIYERNEEKLLLLGPVLERIQTELLIPLFERVYGILERAGSIPPPPPELVGMDLKPEFTGLLAQAQKMAATQSVKNAAAFAAELASADPKVLDKFNADQALDVYSSMLGIPTGIIRSDDETKKVREKAAMEAESRAKEEAALREAKEITGFAKTLSGINMDKKSALTELAGGL